MKVRLHELTPVMTAADRDASERQQQRQQRQLAMSGKRWVFSLDAARNVFAEKCVKGAGIPEFARRAGGLQLPGRSCCNCS